MDYRPHVIKQARASGYVIDVGFNKDGYRLMLMTESQLRGVIRRTIILEDVEKKIEKIDDKTEKIMF